jgi:low temperature requirement protein LtrA
MARISSLWHRPPVLRSKQRGEGERHASWLELFFDLVFVIAVAELSHYLHDHLSLVGLATFAVLFVPVWWLWIDFSYYGDQFDTDDVLYRVAMFAAMFGLLVLTAFLETTFTGGSLAFGITYLAMRLLLIILYWRAWRYVAEAKELSKRYLSSFSVSAGLWLVSLFVPEPYRYVLWFIGIAIEISNGPVAYTTVKNIPRQVSHMDERFGLFTIIVLGESIVAVATGTLDTAWQWQSVTVAAAGFIIAVCMWWLYFDWSDSNVINQALRSDRRGLLKSFVYGYSHLFVYGGIAAASVGLQVGIEAAIGGLGGLARFLGSGGIAVFLLGLCAVHWASPSEVPRAVLLARSVTAVLVVALVFLPLNTVALALSVTALLVALVMFELPRANAAEAGLGAASEV